MNYSNCKFEEFEGISPKGRFGYFIGIAPSYQINKKIQLQVDFQYSLKGYDTGIDNNPIPSRNRYGYLDIIPEVEFDLLRYLVLGIGLNYGIKVNEQVKINNGDWSDPIVESIRSTDFGLVCKLETNYKNLFALARYNIGLINVSEFVFTDDNGQVNDNAKQFIRNLQIGIGYKLKFKKE
ncbi:MAG: outer membrane beta-barrel protein [Saprospiraceae bacterium]|nr:outer membrane beta-barrel protein [Saprospiraceae bacterium]MBL0260524.1 outer membrane beta-barrel protein [Saprospiraceae bacterium]